MQDHQEYPEVVDEGEANLIQWFDLYKGSARICPCPWYRL